MTRIVAQNNPIFMRSMAGDFNVKLNKWYTNDITGAEES